jgi:hypothetical protein
MLVGSYLDRIINSAVSSVKTFVIDNGAESGGTSHLVDMFAVHRPKLIYAVPPEKEIHEVVRLPCATEVELEKHLEFLNFPPGTLIFFGEMRFPNGDIQYA